MALRSTVNQMGRELEALGYVTLERSAYNQKDKNCFEIACYLAELCGYGHPKSRRELIKLIFTHRRRQLFGGDPLPTETPSEACFVIRTPDNPTNVHVAFELYGKEFNYGPGTREDFPIERRIYLRKKTEEPFADN